MNHDAFPPRSELRAPFIPRFPRALRLSFLIQITIVIAASWAIVGASHAEPAARVEPIPTMRIVFSEIKHLLPLSMNEFNWSAPESREEVLASLDRLEWAASALEKHGRSREAGFDELALSLSRDLREITGHYRNGDYEGARFFLIGSLQNCVSCHIRLPYKSSFPLADELLEQGEIQKMTPRDKAWLYVTVRRFEAALSTWEGLMHDPAISIAEIDAKGILVDYLNVALRVRADVARPRRELKLLAKRSDLPVYLESRVQEWLSALDSLDPRKFGPDTPPSLEFGVELAKKAGQVSDGPFGRDGLVHDLAAASQLVRWLEQDRMRQEAVTRNSTAKERRDTAQAYYSLGVVEARSLDGFWVSLSERHLEAAVRSDPKGPIAERAYIRLEEKQMLGYGGASGANMPADVWTNLRELRNLMTTE